LDRDKQRVRKVQWILDKRDITTSKKKNDTENGHRTHPSTKPPKGY